MNNPDEVIKIDGPYFYGARIKDKARAGRAFFQYTYADGRKKHVLRSRRIVEEDIGRTLRPDEHIHHINGDVTDDRIENLEILSASEHATLSLTGRPSPLKGKEKGFTHGTLYGWMKKKCQCDICLKAKKTWHGKRSTVRRNKRKDAGVAEWQTR
ncbi:MAG: HNH endonuclease [Dehalococcoidia bacterium]